MSNDYKPAESRYQTMNFRRVVQSGIQLPLISLGLWHNFGGQDSFENMKKMCLTAFDKGVTYFDLANNYGPPAGSAEENFGRILSTDFKHHRNELFIATKAGYYMWPGPYGEWGSRKYLLSSLDESLKRMNLDYVDLFYSHRFDPETPLEETMSALAHAVKTGKTLYAGVSNYNAEQLTQAVSILKSLNTPCFANQIKYSIFHQKPLEENVISTAQTLGVSLVIYSPLAQGLLTNRYLNGIPTDSRAMKSSFLKPTSISDEVINKSKLLNQLALNRNQNLTQMALSWVLRHPIVATAIIGASKPEQIIDSIESIKRLDFTMEELKQIQSYIKQ